jgi:hypothetical protein
MEMLKSQKSQLTCSYCSRIFKDPIDLPCGDSICLEHLLERDVRKQNKIKCKKCKKEFQVNPNEFKSNEALKKLVESQSHLSEDEISLKLELEESIKKFFEFYDEFSPKRTQLELDIFNHFQELRFQIDEHREELKKRIDDIALAIIDQTKIYEETFSKSLKEKFSSFDDSQSLENEMNQIEELFRNPNLVIKSIKEMQRKQEESLKDIQLNLNEMSKIKDDLMKTNAFRPNLSSFNQEEDAFLFGSIKLNACWLNVNSFKCSQILTDERQMSELIDLCEFSPNDKWSLLYRGTRDGFGSSDFHLRCDGHSNTLTILKAKYSSYIFGGYTTVSWDSTSEWKSDPSAFLFSLTNKDNKPVKMEIDPNEDDCAICCHSRYGPIFGFDLCIVNNAKTTMKNYSNLGWAYKHPQYEDGTYEAQTFLTGSNSFLLAEIEVYGKKE